MVYLACLDTETIDWFLVDFAKPMIGDCWHPYSCWVIVVEFCYYCLDYDDFLKRDFEGLDTTYWLPAPFRELNSAYDFLFNVD